MTIPFLKAHGAKNDFLLTPSNDVSAGAPLAELARAICDRHTGIGADGWIRVLSADKEADRKIELWNADGSQAEISGNGTRCAAAFLVSQGLSGPDIKIQTGAGVKYLRLMEHRGLYFTFEMNMGTPEVRAARCSLRLAGGDRDVTVVWVGNPQCAVPVENFEFDWRKMGSEIESHPQFSQRTNVSFFRILNRHNLEVAFYERGVGETWSSGTGSTGAVAAAMSRGLVETPVTVHTRAGLLEIRGSADLYLVGPAEIIGKGEFYCGKIGP
jgi:diaminopimelate epimerase